MCMSVPQMAVFATSMSTSLGPTLGSGMSSSQMPGAACCLTSAFMLFPFMGIKRRVGSAVLPCRRPSVDHAEIATDTRERLERLGELLARQCRGHLGAYA